MPMKNFLSAVGKISEKLGKPYVARSSVFFIIQKDNCYIQIHFMEDYMLVEGYVGGASLNLSSRDLSDFVFDLKQLSSVHITALNFKVDLELEGLSGDSFPIFPRIKYGVSELRNRSDEEIAGFLEGTYKVLIETSKTVNRFRAKDKGFVSLAGLWKKAMSSMDKNEKGKLLEDFFALFIGKDENFVVTERNLRTESEELDIVVENKGMTQFFSQISCPLILFECKNWLSKIGSKEI